MKRTCSALGILTLATLSSIQLTGCDATDAAYFNLAAQCYNRYPNDSWAQQQCVNQGSAIINDYQAGQQCDNDVAFNERQVDYYWSLANQNAASLDATYNTVVNYSRTIQQCLLSYSYNYCYQQHTSPTLSQINNARQLLTSLQNYRDEAQSYRQAMINRCSRYYTFGNPGFEDNGYFAENHTTINAWQSFVTERTDYWKRYYNR